MINNAIEDLFLFPPSILIILTKNNDKIALKYPVLSNAFAHNGKIGNNPKTSSLKYQACFHKNLLSLKLKN